MWLISGYLVCSLIWTAGILVYYFIFYSKDDFSGDEGLTWGSISLLPWVWPILFYLFVLDMIWLLRNK